LKERIDGVLSNDLADTLLESSRLISSSHLLLDRVATIVNGKQQLLADSSRQISASWEDRRWWMNNIANKYVPRTEGLAPMLVRSGTLRGIQSKKSKFFFNLDQWGKKE
jgi:hypothetical protein